MCDRSNAEEIVSEMLSYLETADYSIREEMVSHGVYFTGISYLPNHNIVDLFISTLKWNAYSMKSVLRSPAIFLETVLHDQSVKIEM